VRALSSVSLELEKIEGIASWHGNFLVTVESGAWFVCDDDDVESLSVVSV
jgi:hypothetical protein